MLALEQFEVRGSFPHLPRQGERGGRKAGTVIICRDTSREVDMSQASEFNERGLAKEFRLEEGASYVIMQFPDHSGCVLRKGPGTWGATADFRPVPAQKRILRKLGVKEGTTYQMIARLLRR